MIPEKGPTFFGMAGVTRIVSSSLEQHLSRLTAVRIVAGATTDFRFPMLGAQQVSRTFIKVRSPIVVAGKTGFFFRAASEQGCF